MCGKDLWEECLRQLIEIFVWKSIYHHLLLIVNSIARFILAVFLILSYQRCIVKLVHKVTVGVAKRCRSAEHSAPLIPQTTKSLPCKPFFPSHIKIRQKKVRIFHSLVFQPERLKQTRQALVVCTEVKNCKCKHSFFCYKQLDLNAPFTETRMDC